MFNYQYIAVVTSSTASVWGDGKDGIRTGPLSAAHENIQEKELCVYLKGF